jgi:hypothetical protein
MFARPVFFAGDLHFLPTLRARQRPRPTVNLDQAISILWRKFADGEITWDVAERADEILRAQRDEVVTPLRRSGL